MATERVIPLVDLGLYINGSDDDKKKVVGQIGEAFQNTGFVGIINHGISKDLIESFYTAAKTFFKLPNDVKSKYELEGLAGQRGFTSFGKEHAKQSKVADLKEFYQLGQIFPKDHPEFSADKVNNPVKEVPSFITKGEELYLAFQEAGTYLLRAIAEYLDLESNYFDDKVAFGNSILRAIYYPPITVEPSSAIRAEQHEDINLITLLVGASAGGLQLLNQKDEWQNIVPEADEIVVNVGDMLQRLTNNYLRSTTHRVVNPPRSEWHSDRLSIPFFLHPKSEVDLTCLPQTVTDDRPLAYEPITAGEYLNQRLIEIGLKK